MNNQEADVLNILCDEPFISQREIANRTGHSLGMVNRCIRSLMDNGYLEDTYKLTDKALKLCKNNSPRSAVILAAGFGMRMIPINMETPKAFLEVKGELLVERVIRQLHEAGVYKIAVVVGFLKEQFEYLIDQFGVELIVNSNYSQKNNLHSLRLADAYIGNSYIIPCDLWCKNNPFSKNEFYSWYMVGRDTNSESNLSVSRSGMLSVGKTNGNYMYGICYLKEDDASLLRNKLKMMDENPSYDDCFWEEALFSKENSIKMAARLVNQMDVVEINSYEQLRDFDSTSNQLHSEAMNVIAQALQADISEIGDIQLLKKGMTNRSFVFKCRNKKYIMRIPGEGTDQLINRKNEAAVYAAISGKGICDDPVYINPVNGYKITEYLDDVRCCNPENPDDIKKCMNKLRQFHEMDCRVENEFDLFEQIMFYENLRKGKSSVYRDYQITRDNVLSLKSYIERHTEKKVLTHIDAVPDNFLFYNRNGKTDLQLIDWEYAGMQDPHVDIAMFCIYSLYDKEKTDYLIDEYFQGECPKETRIKIYCYIAACGLLWSNWCEYKSMLGVEFGEYSLRQYRYAKDYYKIVDGMLRG